MDSFQNGELRFEVRDHGPPEGPPVVLLHGFPQDAASWDAVVSVLNARGLRTLAFDQRGYAAGARPRGIRAYRISLLVDDVVALLDAAQVDRAHVVGHDWGGAVAWALACRRPERVTTLSVLSTPHPAAFARSLVTGDQLRRSWYVFVMQIPGLAEMLVGPWRPRGEQRLRRLLGSSDPPPGLVDRAVASNRDRQTFTAAVNWYRAMAWWSPRQAFSRCRVPTLYVWSTGDAALGRQAADLTRRYVDAPYTFEVLEGTSHWLPEAEPEKVADLVAAHIAAYA